MSVLNGYVHVFDIGDRSLSTSLKSKNQTSQFSPCFFVIVTFKVAKIEALLNQHGLPFGLSVSRKRYKNQNIVCYNKLQTCLSNNRESVEVKTRKRSQQLRQPSWMSYSISTFCSI